MRIIKIVKADTSYTIFQETDEVDLNPLDYLYYTYFLPVFNMSKQLLLHKFPNEVNLCEKKAREFAAEKTRETIDNIRKNVSLPVSFKELLSNDLTKKEQVRLLKGSSLTSEQIGILLIEAAEKGYRLNLYHEEFIANQGKEGYPFLIEEQDDGSVNYCGKSDWTENEMKTLIHQSNRFVARVLVKENDWHCFYATKKGLAEEEHYSFPHLHYISNKFGITLNDFVEKFKSGKCSSSKVHIPLLNYYAKTIGNDI